MKLLPATPYNPDSGRDTDSDTDTESLADHPLSPFPTELLCQVLDALQRRDLATCILVNSAFCSLSLPLLHNQLLLSEDGPWPLFDDDTVHGPLSHDRPRFLHRKPLALATRRLDIHPHRTSKCRSQHPSLPPLPRLHVLRIYLSRTWSGARVFHTDVDLGDAYRRPETSCAALHHLHPPTLVLRGATLARPTAPRHELPLELEESVDHYITVFEPDEPYFLPRNALATSVRSASHFRSRLPANCTHLTVIFKPQVGSWRIGTPTLTWRLIHSYAAALWTQLVVWISRREETRLTIVNCGALAATEGTGMPDAESQARMQEEVEVFIGNAVRERVDDPDRVLKGIRCVSMAEYLANEEWGEVFDVEEVAGWLHDVD